jgi:hypothetical protein
MNAGPLILVCLAGALIVGVAIDLLRLWERSEHERAHERAAARRRAIEAQRYADRWGDGAS